MRTYVAAGMHVASIVAHHINSEQDPELWTLLIPYLGFLMRIQQISVHNYSEKLKSNSEMSNYIYTLFPCLTKILSMFHL